MPIHSMRLGQRPCAPENNAIQMLPVAAMVDARPDVFQRWANTVLLVPMPISNRPMSAALRICVNDGQTSPRTRAIISNNDPAVRKRVAHEEVRWQPGERDAGEQIHRAPHDPYAE